MEAHCTLTFTLQILEIFLIKRKILNVRLTQCEMQQDFLAWDAMDFPQTGRRQDEHKQPVCFYVIQGITLLFKYAVLEICYITMLNTVLKSGTIYVTLKLPL